MARLSHVVFALCAALAQVAPASAQQACRVTISSSSGAGGGACVVGSTSGSIQVPGGPSVAFVVADPCEFTITNGPFNGITGTATKVDKC
ncbi:hypothetical protein CPLU01_08486 [Colletotrichum plurivorum]|uniref:ToxB-like N-terminal ascomycota domain-containing protein n=1 Tax=Colletotrichum plurivorum TaxID=2175906 RepID=A0A8H6KBE4_9PEZI|nr:hypothetical protein CPLU01_08486 [Colletotrichum plurivorum]